MRSELPAEVFQTPAIARAFPFPEDPMGVVLGADARHVITRGELVASFQYVNDEPAVCFYPRYRSAYGRPSAAYIICLSSFWKYVEDAYLVQQSRIAAKIMGFDENSKQTVFRIASFMQDMMNDLVVMKPQPDSMSQGGVVINDVRLDGNKIRVDASLH